MSTAKHAPGPWAYDNNSGDAGGLVVWAANRDRVARVCWYGEQSETPQATEANARLIAAAPDYFAGAAELLRWAQQQDDDAKAEGFGGGAQVAKVIRKALAAAHAKATGGDDLDDAIEANGGGTWL